MLIFFTVTFKYLVLPRFTSPKFRTFCDRLSAGRKFALTLSGPLMVTVVEALLALAPGPVQLEKTQPVAGVAFRITFVPGRSTGPMPA